MMQALVFSVVDGIESKPVTPDIIWVLFVRHTSATWAVFGCPVLAELDGLWLCQQVTWCFRRTFQDFNPFTGPNLMLYTISADLNFKLSISFPIVANFPAAEFWMNPGTFWKLCLSSQNCLRLFLAFPDPANVFCKGSGFWILDKKQALVLSHQRKGSCSPSDEQNQPWASLPTTFPLSYKISCCSLQLKSIQNWSSSKGSCDMLKVLRAQKCHNEAETLFIRPPC